MLISDYSRLFKHNSHFIFMTFTLSTAILRDV